MRFPWGSVQLVIVQRTPPQFVPSLVVNEQQGRECYYDARQAEGQGVTDVMARYTSTSFNGRQFGFRFFGFEVGHGLFSSDHKEIKRRNLDLVALV
jgi:hypothetical protein